MTDEEVIKRRLLIDGDGTGDDRRLNVMLKILTKWAHSPDQTSADNQVLYDKMLGQLGLCEFSVKRSQLMTKSTSKQLAKYKEIKGKLEEDIIATKESIVKSKDNLIKAKIWKQNQIMYDLLAQSIEDQPARKDTNKKLENLQADLKALNDESKSLQNKLDLRRKQFQVLAQSANQLRAMLEEVGNDDPDANTSLDDVTNSPEPEPMSE